MVRGSSFHWMTILYRPQCPIGLPRVYSKVTVHGASRKGQAKTPCNRFAIRPLLHAAAQAHADYMAMIMRRPGVQRFLPPTEKASLAHWAALAGRFKGSSMSMSNSYGK